MEDESHSVSDLYALIGIAVAEFIREDRAFKAHDIALSLHYKKLKTTDKEFHRQCDAAIRLLADLMH